MLTQFVFIRNDANIIDLTLNLRQKVLIGALSAGLSIGIASVLVGVFKFGVVGLTIGFITGQSVLTFGYPMIVGRYLAIPPDAQLQAVFRPACVTLLFLGTVSTLEQSVVAKSWLELALFACATAALLSLLGLFLGLTGEQRRQILSRAKKVFHSG
jgi:hypothetical protein